MITRRWSRTKVFICYSHKDSEWLNRLQVHLAPIARNYDIEIWDDTKIRSGSKWKEEIQEAVKCARVAVLLVSADFLASEFITTEELPPLLQAARKEGARILPVILSTCGFLRHAILSQFQAVNKPSEPVKSMRRDRQEAIFDKVATEIEDILKAGLSSRLSMWRRATTATKDIDENIPTRQLTESVSSEEKSLNQEQDETRSILSKELSGDGDRKSTKGFTKKIFNRWGIAVTSLVLLIGLCVAVLWSIKYFANDRTSQASTSGLLSDKQVKVTVRKGSTARIFDNSLSINLKEIEFDEGSDKYKVIALVSSPDKPPLVIKDKYTSGTITYYYPETGKYKIWVLSSDANRAEFIIEPTGN